MRVRINVEADDSGSSSAAVRWALNRAAATGAEVVLDAQRLPGDLLVVRDHGGRTLEAHGTVVVVPEDTLFYRSGVVVGVASGGRSDAAVIAGAREAGRLGQQLSLVHVAADATESRDEACATLATAAASAAAAVPGLSIRRLVMHRRCADVLLEISRAAALLVLGGSGAGPAADSTARTVLLNPTSPVMIVGA